MQSMYGVQMNRQPLEQPKPAESLSKLLGTLKTLQEHTPKLSPEEKLAFGKHMRDYMSQFNS